MGDLASAASSSLLQLARVALSLLLVHLLFGGHVGITEAGAQDTGVGILTTGCASKTDLDAFSTMLSYHCKNSSASFRESSEGVWCLDRDQLRIGLKCEVAGQKWKIGYWNNYQPGGNDSSNAVWLLPCNDTQTVCSRPALQSTASGYNSSVNGTYTCTSNETLVLTENVSIICLRQAERVGAPPPPPPAPPSPPAPPPSPPRPPSTPPSPNPPLNPPPSPPPPFGIASLPPPAAAFPPGSVPSPPPGADRGLGTPFGFNNAPPPPNKACPQLLSSTTTMLMACVALLLPAMLM